MRRSGKFIMLLGVLSVFFAVKWAFAQTSSSTNISANKSNLQIVRETTNISSAENESTFSKAEVAHVVLSVYSPAAQLSNITISDFLSNAVVSAGSIRNSKITLSDGTVSDLSPTLRSADLSVHFDVDNILQGKNTIEYDYEVAD